MQNGKQAMSRGQIKWLSCLRRKGFRKVVVP